MRNERVGEGAFCRQNRIDRLILVFILSVTVSQRDATCSAEALITVAEDLSELVSPAIANARGLTGYTFKRAVGELWRSRFDIECNLIVVNSGHRDFVFATRTSALQLRHLVRL